MTYTVHAYMYIVHVRMHAQAYLCVARDQIYNLPEPHQLEGHVVI